MPFVRINGLKGKVYVPRTPDGSSKKHPCRECYSCQNCNDDRCRVCRSQSKCSEKPAVVPK